MDQYLIWEAPKDPEATKDYSLDWTAWLDGREIASAIWTLPADSQLNKVQDQVSGNITTIWLSGGVPNSYLIECEITTTDNTALIEPRHVILIVRQT